MSKFSHNPKAKMPVTERKQHAQTVQSKNTLFQKVTSYFRYKVRKNSTLFQDFAIIALAFLIFSVLFACALPDFKQTPKVVRPNIISPQQTLAYISPKQSEPVQEETAFQVTDTLESVVSTDTVEVVEIEPIETEEVINEYRIPNVVYLHTRQSSISYISAFPEVIEEKLSEDDIAVDLSYAFDSGITYDCSAELENVFCLIVQRESGNQSLLGQLVVAEGVVSRVFSGAYGPSTLAKEILKQGYNAIEDDYGNLHIYAGNGKEVTTYSESVQKIVKLALNGSRVSHTILKAVTERQNTLYNLQLDDTYSNWGTIYHYNPSIVSVSQLQARSIRRAPVSFQLGAHVLYGYWLSYSQQLNI